MIDFLLNNIVFVVVIVFGLFRLLTSASKSTGQNESETRNERPIRPTTKTPTRPTSEQSNSSDIFGELKDLFKEVTEAPPARDTGSNERQPANSAGSNGRQTRAEQNAARKEKQEAKKESAMSASAAHEAQLEKLRAQYTTEVDDSKYENMSTKGIKKGKTVEGKYSEGIEDTDVKKLLNQRNLQESIVMAEVLGPPRAYRPHQSSFRKRNI